MIIVENAKYPEINPESSQAVRSGKALCGFNYSQGFLFWRCFVMSKFIDMTGKRFGRWTVIERSENDKYGNIQWQCVCDCGVTRVVSGGSLRSGRTVSCGCYMIDQSFKDLRGKKFGRLTVIKRILPNITKGHPRWECSCDCGKTVVVNGNSLKTGNTVSCGCYKMDACTTHGESNSAEYSRWHHMKIRCLNKNSHAFNDYGGRGIVICDRWLHSYENFRKDMGRCPKGLTIERIDNNGNYEPDNCKWATQKEQNGNTRANVWIEFNGIRRIKMEWLRRLKVTWQIWQGRKTKQGLTEEETLKYFIAKGDYLWA